MKIFDQIKNVCNKHKIMGKEIWTRSEIVTKINKKYGTNISSIIPSDYCYNRINKGINFDKLLFIHIGKGEFRYIGEKANYNGWVYCKQKNSNIVSLAGLWKKGESEPELIEDYLDIVGENAKKITNNGKELPLIEVKELYQQYHQILDFEAKILKCAPTELRHLVGRICELKCILETGGSFPENVNEKGYDVLSKKGKRISVKGTAQKEGVGQCVFNKNTWEFVDDVMIIRYEQKQGLKVLYYGSKEHIEENALEKNKKYILTYTKAVKLQENFGY